MLRICVILLVVLLCAGICPAGVRFVVTPRMTALSGALGGRIIVYVKSRKNEQTPPRMLEGAEYLFGVDANPVTQGTTFDVDDTATAFPLKPSALPEGNYLAQAVFDWHQDDSNWRREPGNLYSQVVPFSVSKDSRVVELTLSNLVEPIHHPTTKCVAEQFDLRSKRLSDFHDREIVMHAAIVFPHAFDPSRKYPAIYRIPGSGGDGISTLDHPENACMPGPARDELAKRTFVIVLDPQSGNGHTLFANSDNNGPCADALARELIPALEATYPLIPRAEGRIVMGHSSGGWAALWLQLQYPDVFGACFSISPDPVDFHCLEQIDIYDDANAYEKAGVAFRGSRLSDARTVREENEIEEVLGPHNSSAQDWDAWQACWGSRDSDGHVASLFDPATGVIDRREVDHWRRYDITDLLHRDPDRYAAIFHRKVRLVVGGEDTFFLNDAVQRLKDELETHPAVDGPGYIRIVPAYDHGSILKSPQVQAWSQEMVAYLSRLKQPPAQ